MKIGRVISSEIAENRDGEKKVLLLKVELSDPDDIQTVEYLQAAGEDFRPQPDTTVIVGDLGEAWKVALGADDGIEPTAAEGEREIYAYSGGQKKGRLGCKLSGDVVAGDGDDYVGQSGKILTELQNLKTHLDALKTAIDSHTHTVPISGPAGTTPTTPPLSPGPTPPTPGSVASSNLKSDD